MEENKNVVDNIFLKIISMDFKCFRRIEIYGY